MSAPTGQSSTTFPENGRAVGLVLEGCDLRLGAAVPRDQLPVLGHLLGEAGAAVAEDAALAVEGDQRRHRDRLVDRELREGHARVPRPVPERQILERALAALVADRAIERMVDEDELERRLLALGRLRRCRARLDHHPVVDGQRAGRPAASGSPRSRRGTCGTRPPAGRAAARSRTPGSRCPRPGPPRRGPFPSGPRWRGRRR